MNFTKNGFTLAEVLITLGIIGIVAAMTMPALIKKQQKIEATARLKKFYSTMQQAILLSENDNGPCGQWEKIPRLGDENGVMIPNPDAAINYFNKYFRPYMKVTSSQTEGTEAIVRFSDGSSVKLQNGTCTDFLFDVNGDRLPNKSGHDIFYFLLCPDNTKSAYFDDNKNFGTYSQKDISLGREKLLRNCKTFPYLCSTLLIFDNWEFKNDYPY